MMIDTKSMPIYYQEPPAAKPKPVPGTMIIKQHRPWRCPLLVVSTIIIMGTVGLLLEQSSLQAIRQSQQIFIKQHWQEQDKSQQQLDKYQHENTYLIAQNDELQEKIAKIVRSTQEGQKTYTDVLQTLKQIQAENYDLTEELAFYKRLLTSSQSFKSSMPEVVVTDFTLDYEPNNKRYPYKIVLTQWTKDAKVATGIVKINLLGQINGKTKRLNMKLITNNATKALKYKFHYFQRLKGYLQLPEAFIPQQIIIRVLPKGRKKANEIRFSFAELRQQEQPEHVGQP